jgi:hypothetical protein
MAICNRDESNMGKTATSKQPSTELENGNLLSNSEPFPTLSNRDTTIWGTE